MGSGMSCTGDEIVAMSSCSDSSKGEVVSIHVGQAGCQIGDECWQMYCLEHGIQPDGTLLTKTHEDSRKTFFSETNVGKLQPRAVFVDLESEPIDKIRKGNYGELFSSEQFVGGKQDSTGGLYASGRYTYGHEIMEVCMESIRCAVESCDNLEGFSLQHSAGGGTGSGVSSHILERLSNEYPKNIKLDFVAYPADVFSSSVIEPYNTVAMIHNLLEHADCTFIMDNQAIYDFCRNTLRVGRGTPRDQFKNLNKIIALLNSSITMNTSLKEIQTNLVPHRRLQFPLVTYVRMPLAPQGVTQMSTEEMINHSLNKAGQCQSIKCNLRKGKFMAVCLKFRGDFLASDVNESIKAVQSKTNIQFVDWCPLKLKYGINHHQFIGASPDASLASSRQSLCLMSNTSAVGQIWPGLLRKFDSMNNKRAFVYHLVGEGMEVDEIDRAREDINRLEQEYKELDQKKPAAK